MEFQCNSIVIPLSEPKKSDGESSQFSISLPSEAIEMIEALKPFGLYGKKKATICRSLILDMLKRPEIQAIIRERGK